MYKFGDKVKKVKGLRSITLSSVDLKPNSVYHVVNVTEDLGTWVQLAEAIDHNTNTSKWYHSDCLEKIND
jgi:hypothetical protein